MLKSFISTLTEGKYGKTVHEFNPAPLSKINRSFLNFMVNEKAGKKKLILVLQEDEGREIEREFCDVDIECLDGLTRLIEDAKTYVKENS